jgi:GNAT superfamily N-acetyltransferase
MKINRTMSLASEPFLLENVMIGLRTGQCDGEFPRHRPDPDGHEVVAYVGQSIAPLGFVTMYPVSDTRLWVDLLYVLPPVRRRGIGRALLAEVRRFAAEQGLSRIEFGTLTSNKPMLALGRAAGFAIEGHILAAALGQSEAA